VVIDAVVAAETLLLAVLALFVVALLRSHAEILRRLEGLEPAASAVEPPAADRVATNAQDVAGETPSGGARHVAAAGGGGLLLAFLSSGCASCAGLIESVADGAALIPPPLRLVVVTKDAQLERRRRLQPLERLVDVVMSSAAWDAYGVPGSPYFVHVDADGTIAGEGSATAWSQVAGLVADALEDRREGSLPRVDAALAAAGIGPGDPSLHPSTQLSEPPHA
jgi:hypothetical protein